MPNSNLSATHFAYNDNHCIITTVEPLIDWKGEGTKQVIVEHAILPSFGVVLVLLTEIIGSLHRHLHRGRYGAYPIKRWLVHVQNTAIDVMRDFGSPVKICGEWCKAG